MNKFSQLSVYFSQVKSNILSLPMGKLGMAFGLFVLPLIFFLQIVDEVRENETLWLDEGILREINKISGPELNGVMSVLTNFGGALWVIVAVIVGCVILTKKRIYESAVLLATGVGGAFLINLILKASFQRDRPMLWERIVTENSYSFPSGHAMVSGALGLCLIFILWRTRWRWYGLIAGVTYILIIGFSRLYLGVHYPTDVAAGWFVSSIWVFLVILVLDKFSSKRS